MKPLLFTVVFAVLMFADSLALGNTALAWLNFAGGTWFTVVACVQMWNLAREE